MTEEFMVRTSERVCFKSCRQKWQWAYVDHLKANRVSAPLTFGSLIHNALEIYYKPGIKRGRSPVLSVQDLWQQYLEDGGTEYNVIADTPAIDLAVEMMKNYISEYGKDEEIEVIAPEQTFQINVHDDNGTYLFTYVGTIDATIRNRRTKRIGFMEHKTGASLEPFGAPVALDEQSGSYWAYGPDWLRDQGILRPDEEVDFLLFNRLRKAFRDTRPTNELGQSLNKNGSVSKQQPIPLFKREQVFRAPGDRATLMERVKMEAREMRMARNGRLGVYKNPDRHCGYCEFREMCEVHEVGSDWEAVRDALFTKWDPYDAHTREEEGVK